MLQRRAASAEQQQPRRCECGHLPRDNADPERAEDELCVEAVCWSLYEDTEGAIQLEAREGVQVRDVQRPVHANQVLEGAVFALKG